MGVNQFCCIVFLINLFVRHLHKCEVYSHIIRTEYPIDMKQMMFEKKMS